jgi:uncharacterized membrane-anchored protein
LRRSLLRIGPATAFWVVVALQVLGVLSFAAVKEIGLRVGREVVLATVPVDPRDLFRGDYVVLRYEVTRFENCFNGIGSVVYVALREREGMWVASGRPTSSFEAALDQGDVVIKGQVSQRTRTSCDVTYGIESYFVPEGTGRAIEQARGKIKMRVVVDGLGNATIKEVLLP